MKRLISVILTLTMIFSLITTIPVQAASYDENSYTLTGVQVNDIVGIAKTQIGYKEGNNSNQLDGTVSGNGNYTKYAKELKAAGYGASNPNAWCAYFVSWCAMKAGCLNSAVSFFTGVKSCVAKSKPYKSNGLGTYHAIKNYTFTNGSVFRKDYTPSNIENYKPKKGDIMIFKTHVGLVVSDYNYSTDSFSIVEGNWGGKVNSRNVKMSNSELVGFVTPDYTTTTITPSHTHSYSYSNDSAHPHSEYKYCSCGSKEYTGLNKPIDLCSKCHPVGNVKLTRSFEKAKGTATFYRNNVSNATNYILRLYQDGSLYNQYTMSSDEKTVTRLPSGDYTATLYAENSNTGEKRSSSCKSFRIVETYTISYNANGGSNAPSSHEKLQDDDDFTLKTQIPTKAHYVFKGWARSENATVAEYQLGDTYTKNAKVTLYAVWEPETYTIKFDANGGKGEIADTTITYGDAIRIPNDVICDYSYLKGWSTSKTATTATYKIGMDYKFDANTTLYAVWGTSTWSGGASASLSGSGTVADPYLIQSESDLGYLANKVNSQTSAPKYEYYKLTNNINFAYNEWVPIGLYGNEYQYFYGSFDGNGFTISDLYITKENEKNVGLFGYVKDGEIKNLTVTGAIESITSSNALNIGAIVGCAENTALKELNTMYFNIGSISAGTADYTRMGTIAGYVLDGTISDCISTDSHIDLKSGKFEAGMIAGYSDANIKDCSVKATTGGLFSTQTTVGEFRLGGLCGNLSANAERCSIYAPYFSNNIKTTAASSVGGLVGYLDGEVKVCSSQFNDETANSLTMNGTGSTEIGGITGFATSGAKITDCKFDGNSISSTATSGSTAVGGLIGTATAKTNPTVSVTGGQSLSRADLPKKNGYKATWYTDAAMTTPYDFSQTVTSNMTLYAKWEDGDDTPDIWDGTSKEPAYNADTKTYTITNGEELAWVSDVTNGVITSGTNFPTDITFSGYTIELANDIYLNDTTNWENWETTPPKNRWKSIASQNVFAGNLNGCNYTIKGIYRSESYTTGGFALIWNNSGVVRNINVSDVYIYIYNPGTSPRFAATLVAKSKGTIQNCHNVNNVYIKAGSIVGGIVANMENGTIINCSNSYKVLISGTGDYIGGIVGFAAGSNINKCYNKGNISKTGSYGGYIGGICGIANGSTSIENSHNNGDVLETYLGSGGIVGALSESSEISRCYSTIGNSNVGSIVGYFEGSVAYCYYRNYLYSGINSETAKVSYCYSKTDEQLKNFWSLTYLCTSDIWGYNSNINDGYPYLKPLEETYKTYKITPIIEVDNSAINRSFANINGNLTGNGSSNANVGGILGSASGSSGANSVAQNVIAIADGISSSHKVGNIVANNSGYFTFNNAYYNTEMNVAASSNSIDTTGTARSEISMNVPFYTNLLGLTPYTSLANVANDNKAVWVLENGKLPELYYNCLNDITISDDIENGSVTIDKTQAVNGEVVTVNATPNEGFVLNKVYVDGVEQDGITFVVNGNDEVYVTFAEEIPIFDVSITVDENASASLVNADAPRLMSIRLMSNEADSSITANDGEEIQVNAVADSDYTVDSIYVNGEEVAGNSFILTSDSVVTMDVTSISTDVIATTNDAEDIGSYFAVVSGSVSGEDENAVKYIRYWSADDADTVYVTEVENGSGDYTAVLTDLKPETIYYYQMTEFGQIKTFTTCEESVDDEVGGEDGEYDETESSVLTSSTYTKTPVGYEFIIECSKVLTDELLCVAIYDENKKLIDLVSPKLDNGSPYEASFITNKKATYAKIFVWKGIGSLMPISEAEKVEITE